MNKQELIDFESDIADRFQQGLIRGPVHLSGGNENELINIFDQIKRRDWVFSTWRSHYHALLHGIPKERVLEQILAKKSMLLNFPEYHFMTSAIVGGIIPIATGVSRAIAGTGREVWCFVGDMAANAGVFYESVGYAERHNLPINFVVEDNRLSCNTPTESVTDSLDLILDNSKIIYYSYTREGPHCGTGEWVTF